MNCSVSELCGMLQYRHEQQILKGCIDCLLPSIGNFVQKIVVNNSLILDDAMVCPLLYLQMSRWCSG